MKASDGHSAASTVSSSRARAADRRSPRARRRRARTPAPPVDQSPPGRRGTRSSRHRAHRDRLSLAPPAPPSSRASGRTAGSPKSPSESASATCAARGMRCSTNRNDCPYVEALDRLHLPPLHRPDGCRRIGLDQAQPRRLRLHYSRATSTVVATATARSPTRRLEPASDAPQRCTQSDREDEEATVPRVVLENEHNQREPDERRPSVEEGAERKRPPADKHDGGGSAHAEDEEEAERAEPGEVLSDASRIPAAHREPRRPREEWCSLANALPGRIAARIQG